jgi:hypothetical protein
LSKNRGFSCRRYTSFEHGKTVKGCVFILANLFSSIRTSHKSGSGLVGGLVAIKELKAFVGSFAMRLGFPGGWAIVTGALGASGSGFCWGPKVVGVGWASRVLKYDIALSKGAECKAAEVIGTWLANYGGHFARESCGFDTCEVSAGVLIDEP